MPVIDRIKDFQNDLVAIRRDIHAHPEIGFEETRTSAIVADLLETWGITVIISSRRGTTSHSLTVFQVLGRRGQKSLLTHHSA